MDMPAPLLKVRHIRVETDDARTFELEVPDSLRAAYRGRAGQFLRVTIPGDPDALARCYSLSSAPELDEPLRFTVKRVAGGAVSGRLVEAFAHGQPLHVAPPTGTFALNDATSPLLLIAGGSGVTPIFSLLKTALATTARPVALLYANRNRAAAIFDAAIAELARIYAPRFTVRHHFSDDEGFLDTPAVLAFAATHPGAQTYVCGPGPLMDMVESLFSAGGPLAGQDLFCERFLPPAAPPEPEPPPPRTTEAASAVTILIGDAIHHLAWTGGTVLDAALAAGIPVPYSCREGHCGACKAKMTEGGIEQRGALALSRRERERGYILACCSTPSTPELVLAYD